MIEIANLTRGSLNKKCFKEVAEKVLKGENKKGCDLSIVFVGERRMRLLNRKYRSQDRPTDVLSFDQSQKFPVIPGTKRELGEVVICPQTVRKNAEKFNSTFKEELTRVLIHGILHLLGYDHEKDEKEAEKMREKEERYLSQI